MTANTRAREGEPANPPNPPYGRAPRLPAYLFTVDDQPGLRAFCRWCNRWHIHGGGYGHRVAHCHVSTSPYKRTGYVLVRPGENTAS